MGINGLEIRRTPLPEAFQEYYRRSFHAGQLAVFGADRLAEDNMPPSESAEQLLWQIEELCTGPEERRFFGVSSRTLRLANPNERTMHLQWNPAGTVGGFDADPEWDGAVASIAGLKVERLTVFSKERMLPQFFTAREDLFFDRWGIPKIRRTIRRRFPRGGIESAIKEANADEVRIATHLLATALANDREIPNPHYPQLPVHLEIGYGLDPMSLRGARQFTTKICVEIDKAVGDFENPIGPYVEAVHAESRRYIDHVKDQKNISFAIGDGEALPLHDASVREIFMSNVINAPLKIGSRLKMLREASRVLEPSGNMVVRVNWHQDEWPHDRMVRLFRNMNFFVPRSVGYKDPEYRWLEAQYGEPQEVAAPHGYYVIACPQ